MSKINFSSGEWKLMKLMWSKSPRTIGEMVDALADDTGWTKTTVFVMLKRLIAKDAVRMDDSGKYQQYYPLVMRDDASCDETESFLSKVYDGSLGLMVSFLADQKKLTDEDIAALQKIIDDAKKNK